MDKETFNMIGEALYGPKWFQPMPASINVPTSSISEWCVGLEPVPELVRNKLYLELKSKCNTILMLIRELED